MTKAGESIEIRGARASDRGFVRALSREVFSRFGPYDEILLDLMASPGIRTLVATIARQRAGFAMFGPDPENPVEIDLAAIAVFPSLHRRGIGRALLREVEVQAAGGMFGRPARGIRLRVALDNLPARRLFEATGYHGSPDRGGSYPKGQRSFRMRKTLGAAGI